MLKVMLLDDEPLALEVLDGYLKKTTGIHSVQLFSHAHEALSYLQHNKIDVLFLDIEMPQITGIEFLKCLPDPPITIFTTAYRNYAFEGFELGVIDFLLKPISFPRFSAAIEKARDFLSLKTENNELETTDLTPEFIFVKSGLRKIKLEVNQISHIQGLKDYAIIHTPDERIVIKGSIKMVQEMFSSNLFIRVHKSFLVASKLIKRIERNRIIINTHQIPIGRNYRKALEEKINL